jgi:hypothetical protein
LCEVFLALYFRTQAVVASGQASCDMSHASDRA